MCGGGVQRTWVAETREAAGVLLCGGAERSTEAWEGREGGGEARMWDCAVEGRLTSVAGVAATCLA